MVESEEDGDGADHKCNWSRLKTERFRVLRMCRSGVEGCVVILVGRRVSDSPTFKFVYLPGLGLLCLHT